MSQSNTPARHSGPSTSSGQAALRASRNPVSSSSFPRKRESSDFFFCVLPDGWKREPIGSNYHVTKKPRNLVIDPTSSIPFIPMDRVPGSGRLTCGYEVRKPKEIASGTYFEAGDILLSKITPSFENGKQGLAVGIPERFGYASTEIIPLQRSNDEVLNLYLFYLLLNQEVRGVLASKMEGSTGRKRVPEATVRELEIPIPPLPEQEKIAAVLWKVQHAIETQDRLIAATRDLKASAMQRLFTHGLRGEPIKETEIGPMPESWTIIRLEHCCDVLSSRLSYTDLSLMSDAEDESSVTIHGVKVSDMNLPGNELEFNTVNLSRQVPQELAERKAIPTDTVVFPKRGAAIATNKKRLTTTWTVLDPNLIGVHAKKGLDSKYLFYWFEQFDLRTITEPGPTPQLNKKNLIPLLLPVPGNEDEQRAIADSLASIDCKLAHHQKKRAAFNELFQTLLHQLMTAAIRVADLEIDTSEIGDHFVGANKMVDRGQQGVDF